MFNEYQHIKLRQNLTEGRIFLPKDSEGIVLETHGNEACEVEFPNPHPTASLKEPFVWFGIKSSDIEKA